VSINIEGPAKKLKSCQSLSRLNIKRLLRGGEAETATVLLETKKERAWKVAEAGIKIVRGRSSHKQEGGDICGKEREITFSNQG